jgi:transposase
MPRIRKSHAPSLKAKVALEAIRGIRTTAQIAQSFGVHPNLVTAWKRQAVEHLPEVFANGHAPMGNETDKDELYKQIGQLKVELEFFKKRAGLPG